MQSGSIVQLTVNITEDSCYRRILQARNMTTVTTPPKSFGHHLSRVIVPDFKSDSPGPKYSKPRPGVTKPEVSYLLSMTSRNWPPHFKDMTPGPGDYNTPTLETTKPKAPCYSFTPRRRPSRFSIKRD